MVYETQEQDIMRGNSLTYDLLLKKAVEALANRMTWLLAGPVPVGNL
jgi:hypothetical protein